MVSCGATECTNQANKKSNIIILVIITIMLLETCSKFFQISKMIRHIENPGIVRTVYSGILRHILGHSAIFSYVQAYWGRLSHIEVYAGILLRHIEPYLDIFRTLCNPCMYKRTIFRTLAYLEPEASSTYILNESSEACQTCKMTRHIQRPGIVRTVYSNIFEDL